MPNLDEDKLYDTHPSQAHVHPHIISILVKNEPGVLARVAGLFSRRGFNIDSLAVGTCEAPGFSRMTIAVLGDDRIVEQITKQLHKLIDTYKVIDLSSKEHVERELMLIRVNADKNNRSEIMQLVDIFRARIVTVKEKSLIIEITGASEKLQAFIDLVRKFGIGEIVRTGRIAFKSMKKGKPSFLEKIMQEQWLKEVITILWILIWGLVGFCSLWMKNTVLPYIFLILFIYHYLAYGYLVVLRYPNYQSGSYLMAYRLVNRILKGKFSLAHNQHFDQLIAFNWIGTTLFPVPFLFFYSAWGWLGFYLIIAGGWYVQEHYSAILD